MPSSLGRNNFLLSTQLGPVRQEGILGKKIKADNSIANFRASITTLSFILLVCGSGKTHYRKLKRKDLITNLAKARLCIALKCELPLAKTTVDHLGKHLWYLHTPLIDECVIYEYSYANEFLMTGWLIHITNGSSLNTDDIRQRGIGQGAFSVVEALCLLLSMVLCANPAAVMSRTYYKLFL